MLLLAPPQQTISAIGTKMSQTIYKLNNGMKILFCSRNHFHSAIISVWINHRFINRPGLAHFVEHLIMDGKNCEKSFILNQQESRWVDSLSATTTDYYTIFDMQTHKSEVDKAIPFLKKFIFGCNFTRINIAETKRIILAEMGDSFSDPFYHIYQRLRQIRFKRKTFLSEPIIGTKTSVSNITRSDIKNFYTMNYIGENAIISVTGHFDQEIIKSLIKETFSTIGNNRNSSIVSTRLPEYSNKQRVDIVADQVSQANFILSLPGYSWQNNLKERLTINLISIILSGLRASRLFQTLRMKEQLVYDIYSETVMENNFGLFNIFGQCQARDIQKVIGIILAEIEQIRSVAVKESELSWFQNYLNCQNEMDEDNLNGLAYEFMESFANSGKVILWEDIIAQRNKITSVDILKAAQKIFDLNKLNIVVSK